jgi:catechol 2,3-dioxygenase-like lactoylglutathione lyase family enzyme
MRIKLNSIFVDNQDKALKFYTDVLGFKKSKEFPVGEFKWLTVASPQGPDDLELVLEPNANRPPKNSRKRSSSKVSRSQLLKSRTSKLNMTDSRAWALYLR